jgi:hypothetical protein
MYVHWASGSGIASSRIYSNQLTTFFQQGPSNLLLVVDGSDTTLALHYHLDCAPEILKFCTLHVWDLDLDFSSSHTCGRRLIEVDRRLMSAVSTGVILLCEFVPVCSASRQ